MYNQYLITLDDFCKNFLISGWYRVNCFRPLLKPIILTLWPPLTRLSTLMRVVDHSSPVPTIICRMLVSCRGCCFHYNYQSPNSLANSLYIKSVFLSTFTSSMSRSTVSMFLILFSYLKSLGLRTQSKNQSSKLLLHYNLF